ncbi:MULTISPECIES: hypothetical protein [Intrasporangiaceae]|uniref:Lipoprotein n=1 Tax=Intrasporangium chromatireducens Q5-1 TaxID=584657 RepID=W9GLR5_9MICO|nr:hypothetical protein [Intrasporangium chromatireducens]EWT06037.1 hypothetical protein N864_00610 [Intrasporangium chromatireducens Q5-1]
MTTTTRRHSVLALCLPLVAASVTLAGCGPKATTTPASPAVGASSAPASAAPPGSSTSGSAPATGTDTASGCPTSNTRAFAKTRLVADLGIVAGTFHRYLYKPWQAGSFNKGANGRTLAIVKAAGAAALDAKLLLNATENIKANPTLCKVLVQPMTQLEGKLAGFKSQALAGNLGFIGDAQQAVTTIEQQARTAGLPITETTNTSGA